MVKLSGANASLEVRFGPAPQVVLAETTPPAVLATLDPVPAVALPPDVMTHVAVLIDAAGASRHSKVFARTLKQPTVKTLFFGLCGLAVYVEVNGVEVATLAWSASAAAPFLTDGTTWGLMETVEGRPRWFTLCVFSTLRFPLTHRIARYHPQSPTAPGPRRWTAPLRV